MMDSKEMALRLSKAVGVSGAESGAADAARELLEPLGAVEISPVGSVLCRIKAPRAGERHYMLDAHLDEIGMIVTGITEDGFLRVGNIGGLDRRLLMASEVIVLAKSELPGVVCSTPPHLQGDGEKKNPKMDELYVDVGLSGERAKELTALGDRLVVKARGRALLGTLITGKALDDRAGCAAVIRAAQLLQNEELACGLTVTLTTQEETGAAGAKTAAFAVAPTHCITVDVSFAHTPDAKRHKCGELGKGPMVGIAPILSGRMSQRLIEIADQSGIPYQLEVMGGATGTNADGIAASGAGVATSLLSIPQRYMHTPIETVDARDIEDTARLIAAYIKAEEGLHHA